MRQSVNMTPLSLNLLGKVMLVAQVRDVGFIGKSALYDAYMNKTAGLR